MGLLGIGFVLILYESGGGARAGSGFLVNDRAVLTADHVAEGTRHRIVWGGREIPVDKTVRSGTDDVDLAVMLLTETLPVAQKHCALVDRGPGGKLTGCSAIGFPRRSKDAAGRVSRQVLGFIRPADGIHAFGNPDGAPLTLVGEEASWSDASQGADAGDTDALGWGGMSGAAVIKDEHIIGVVTDYDRAKGSDNLIVTPLTALRLMPAERQAEFVAALRLKRLADLPRFAASTETILAMQVPSSPNAQLGREPAPEFSSGIRERYGPDLTAAGVPVPGTWDTATLAALRRAHRAQDNVENLLEVLCLAIEALPLFENVGGREIGLDRLDFLYRQHLKRRPPDARSREDLLIHAASATLRERRTSDGSEQVTALARFMLGVAGVRRAPASLEDPELRGLAEWLVGPPLKQQRQDVEEYLANEVKHRTWALIELDAAESSAPRPVGHRSRPTGVIVDLIREHGKPDCIRIECDTDDSDDVETVARKALRKAMAALPDGVELVDLCLPRSWLNAGIERWDVVPTGATDIPMSQRYSTRLRWSMHRHDRDLRRILERYAENSTWSAAPEALSTDVTSDAEQLSAWIQERTQDETSRPPYVLGTEPERANHDPLAALLLAGYGFAVWFAAGAGSACADAASLANDIDPRERRDAIPSVLGNKLWKDRPVIVWSDPRGREGFRLPPPRDVGQKRTPKASQEEPKMGDGE